MYKFLIFFGVFLILIFPIWKLIDSIYKIFIKKIKRDECSSPEKSIEQIEAEIFKVKDVIDKQQKEEEKLLEKLNQAKAKLQNFNGFEEK